MTSLQPNRPAGQKKAQTNARAFSRIEALTVVAVVAALTLVQSSSLANSKGRSRTASCLLNLRILATAWTQYAADHAGVLVGNLDGGSVMFLANSNRTWVLGWLDFSDGAPAGANTNTAYLTVYSPLAPYTGRDARVFKCPADSSLSRGSSGLPRVRSVSMNAYMGNRAGPYTAGYRQFKKISDLTKPTPAEAFVFLDEREDNINDGWFAVNMEGYDPERPTSYIIVDYPSERHNRAANLSFADGHAETWRWLDPRTMPGGLLQLNVASPNNPDVARLQRACSSRVQ